MTAIEGVELEAIKKVYTDCVPFVDELDEKSLAQKVYDVATGLGIEPKRLFIPRLHRVILYAVIRDGEGICGMDAAVGKERKQKTTKNQHRQCFFHSKTFLRSTLFRFIYYICATAAV